MQPMIPSIAINILLDINAQEKFSTKVQELNKEN
jgi:hypothetical protein